MNKFILALALILTMALTSFLKGYGEEVSMRAEYDSQRESSRIEPSLKTGDVQAHDKKLDGLTYNL